MTKHLKLKSKDAAALEEFLRRLRAGLGNKLTEVKLFGSKATGRDEPESDIDVLIVVDDATVEIEDQVLDIAFEVNLAHELYISPRVLSRSVLEDPVWKITPFLQAIAKEGITLKRKLSGRPESFGGIGDISKNRSIVQGKFS